MKMVKAGLAYWAFIFGLGFILGAIRTLWLAPLLNSATLAVLIELPFMLIASWFAARTFVAHWSLEMLSERLAMGGIGFALLMASEAFLGIVLMGDSIGDWLAGLVAIPGIIGLAGQLLFAIFPAMVGKKDQSPLPA